MTDQACEDATLLADRFRELANPACPDRGAKLQCLCTQLWDMLEQSPRDASQYIDDFVALLQNQNDLLVARLVIPELRSGAMPPQNALQRKVVHETAGPRANLQALDESSQSSYDQKQPDYMSEKRIFQEAEMYRASVMLFNSGSLNKEESAQVKRWIEECPVKKTAGRENLV